MGLFGDLFGVGSGTEADMPSAESSTDDTYPEVDITRVEPHPNGDRMDVWVQFMNRSNKNVKINGIELLNQNVHLNQPLGPGQSHEFHVWQGTAPDSDAYDKAWLYFEDDQHAYKGDYYVKYDYDEHTKRYFIESLRRESPIERL